MRVAASPETAPNSPPEKPAPAAGDGWPRAGVVFAASLAALSALFWPALSSMVMIWATIGTYGHGFVIAPVTGYLIWRRRHLLGQLTPAPQPLGLAAVAAAAFVWLVGNLAGAQVVEQFALVAMIQALVLVVFGWPVTRAVAFPLFFLYFAVPFGNFLIAPLQDLTAEFVVRMLRLTGMPVYIEGLLIYIPSGTFHVAEACSGVRFLISTVAIGFLGANLFYRSWRRRALFIALSFAVPIVANGFRAYGIVMIAHLSDYRIAAGVDHLIWGWMFLSVVTLSLLGLGMLFREHEEDPAIAAADRSVRPATLFRFSSAGLAAVLVAGAAVAVGSATTYRETGQPLIALPAPPVTAPWTPSNEATANPWQPRFAGADGEVRQSYVANDRRVDLYVAYYVAQRQGAEAVNEVNRFGVDGWEEVGQGRRSVIVGGVPLTVTYTRLRAAGGGRIVWSWYWVDGRFTSNPLQAKVFEIWARLSAGPRAAAVVAIAADYGERQDEAEATLQAFLDHLGPLAPHLRQQARANARTAPAPSANP